MSIVFAILKVIGWVLLALVLLLVFFLLMLCFHPFFYRISGRKGEEGASFEGRVSWLFHIFGLEADAADGEIRLLFRVFCFRKPLIFGQEEEKPEEEEPEILWESGEEEAFPEPEAGLPDKASGGIPSEDGAETAGGEEDSGDGDTERSDDPEESGEEGFGNPEGAGNAEEAAPEEDRVSQHKAEESIWDRFTGWVLGQKQNLENKIKFFRKQWKKGGIAKRRIERILTDEENKLAFAHLKREAVRILRAVMPRTLKLSMEFSAGEPDVTGILLGILAMFPVGYRNRWRVLPDFEAENPYIRGEFAVRGRLMMGHVFAGVIRILFDRRCRRMYAMIRKYSDLQERHN